MTFCSNEQDKIKTIKNIDIEDNKYIINYFNNSQIYKNNFIEDKNHLEDLMIRQAKEREKEEYLVTNINTWGSIITWFICCGTLGSTIRNGAFFMSLCFSVACLVLLKKHKKYKSQLNELKKYKILLENYDNIKDNVNLYKKVRLKKYDNLLEKNNIIKKIMFKNQEDGVIDIFNIDEFNLNDIKYIKKQLKKRN